jgi:hypothetical protein
MIRRIAIHPLLFAVFPILFSLANNMDQFSVGVVLLPAVTAVLFTAVCSLLVGLLLKSWAKAGLILSLFLVLFFSYENCWEEIRGVLVDAGMPRIEGHIVLLAVWAVVFAVAICLIVRGRRDLGNVTYIVNVMAASLVGISLINICTYEFRARSLGSSAAGLEKVIPESTGVQQVSNSPDIYYIILDGYGSAPILDELYQYDNGPFLEYLTNRGFYVATGSRPNYCQTALSLASSLNLQYLDGLVDLVGAEYPRRGPLSGLVQDNQVFQFVRSRGYKIVAFSTGWSISDLRNADVYRAPRWSPDEFQTALVNMTPIPFVVDQLGALDEYDAHRERILYALDHLADFAQMQDPVFVFVHVIVPHPPFVFGPHGEEIDPDYPYALHDGSKLIVKRRLTREQYIEGYRNQVIFVNDRIKSAVDAILSQSDEPPIIILQADHGPGSLLDWENVENTYLPERMSIFNAYYFPDGNYARLYDSITPVNSFRIVLDQYFGLQLGLLEDKSYFSTWSEPYAFIDVTDKLNQSGAPDLPE